MSWINKPNRFSTAFYSTSQAFFPMGLIHLYAGRSVQPSPQKDCRAAAKRPGAVSDNGGTPIAECDWIITGGITTHFRKPPMFFGGMVPTKRSRLFPSHHMFLKGIICGYCKWVVDPMWAGLYPGALAKIRSKDKLPEINRLWNVSPPVIIHGLPENPPFIEYLSNQNESKHIKPPFMKFMKDFPACHV